MAPALEEANNRNALRCVRRSTVCSSRSTIVIKLTRLNSQPIVINADLIEHVDITPDTVIALTTGGKFMVLEPVDEVIERVKAFRRSLQWNLPVASNRDFS